MRRWSIMSLLRQFQTAMPKRVPQSGGIRSPGGFLRSFSARLGTPGPTMFGASTRRCQVPVGGTPVLFLTVCLFSLLLIGGCSPESLVKPDAPPVGAATLGQDKANEQSLPDGLPPADFSGADLSSPGLNDRYRVGPQDVLTISMVGEEVLSARVVVGPDGWISFPMAGQILASGMTVSELEREITSRLRETIRDPLVSVAIAEPAGYQVYVVGKVSKPGQFIVGRKIDVLQALALAGGLTPFADENDIKVLRQSATGQATATFPFDYASIKRGKNLRQNILLQSGDVVVVP